MHLDAMTNLFTELRAMYLEREGTEGDLPAIMDEYLAVVDHIRTSMRDGDGPTVTERIEAEANERKAKEEADRRRREEQEGMPGWEEMQIAREMREKRLVAAKRAKYEKHSRMAERQKQESGSIVAATS